MTPRLYEAFVLHETIRALVETLPGWDPELPSEPERFLARPYLRLQLPGSHGELIWQPSYPHLDGFPIRSVSHDMRPDLVIEGSGTLFVVEAKYRLSRKAALGSLDKLHAYRDALVNPAGYEVVTLAVASMPTYEASEALYYQSGFLAKAGLGLVYLPPPGRAAPTAAGLVTLRQAVDRFLSLPAEAPPARHLPP